DGDGIPARQGHAERTARFWACLALPNERRIAALGKLDDEIVGVALRVVIPVQSRAKAARLNANDRIGARIERRILAKHLDADDVFLQFIPASFEVLGHDELEES